MGRARYNTGLFPLPDNVLPVQLFGGTSEGPGVCNARALPPENQRNHPKPRNTTSLNSSKIITTHYTLAKTKNNLKTNPFKFL